MLFKNIFRAAWFDAVPDSKCCDEYKSKIGKCH